MQVSGKCIIENKEISFDTTLFISGNTSVKNVYTEVERFLRKQYDVSKVALASVTITL